MRGTVRVLQSDKCGFKPGSCISCILHLIGDHQYPLLFIADIPSVSIAMYQY